jgi:L-seryl-tRNA(Ser) seleniumtransferase
MQIPPFRGFGPAEAIKQLTQWVNQPVLTHALREAAQKLGIREVPSLSSLQELVRQAGRWVDAAAEPWSNQLGKVLTPGINATGEWFSGRWTTSKWTPDSLALLHLIHASTTEDYDAEGNCRNLLTSTTGAADALVAPSLSIALHVAIQGLLGGKRMDRVVLPRKHCIRIPGGPMPSGSMLPDLISACGVPIREIGTNTECLASDFDRALETKGTLLLLASGSVQDESVGVGIARSQEVGCITCEVAIAASLHDLVDVGFASHALSRRWDRGPDLILVPGQYLLGGPECGILLGKRDIIQSIRQYAELSGMLADRTTHLLLADTVRRTQTREAWNVTPTGSVITNSVANLENRAKRIAMQCETPESPVSLTCRTQRCRFGSGLWHDCMMDSAVLQITPKPGHTVNQLAERFAHHTPAIWGNILSDRIEWVLRTVDPSEDTVLVSAIESLASSAEDGKSSESATHPS